MKSSKNKTDEYQEWQKNAIDQHRVIFEKLKDTEFQRDSITTPRDSSDFDDGSRDGSRMNSKDKDGFSSQGTSRNSSRSGTPSHRNSRVRGEASPRHTASRKSPRHFSPRRESKEQAFERLSGEVQKIKEEKAKYEKLKKQEEAQHLQQLEKLQTMEIKSKDQMESARSALDKYRDGTKRVFLFTLELRTYLEN